MECKEEENGQTLVIPIFYDLDPSHVRNQRVSFAKAFAKHESKYKNDVEGMQKVQRWRNALTETANLKGYDIRQRAESENIQQIVNQISSKLCKTSISYLQDIVGIDTHLEEVKSQLKIEINDVWIVGIWGMGGIGKTTIARAIFDILSDQFEAASSRLHFNKVLVVLDDIDHSDHLDYLAGNLNWYGDGSKIIVTTRDKHLIGKNDVVNEVTTLVDNEAIKLFNEYAFQREVPDECFEKLSLEIVRHAKGLPLALKVWGSFLHKRDIIEWRSAIEEMKNNSNSKIVEKLRISYDGLETTQQDIFLDISCFFRGKGKSCIMQILKSCYSGANIGLRVLIDKSLVFISKKSTIEMHDLIQEMGKYVRILYIYGFDTHNDSIEYLPNNLRWFDCCTYPWESLPENFEPKKLVHLDLQSSSLSHLWTGTKHLPSLCKLDLYYTKRLIRTPEFTGMQNLEYLDLQGCTSLEEVHPSLGCCRKLVQLNLRDCGHLKRFPCVNVESIECLQPDGCYSLEKFPEILGTMKLELDIKMSSPIIQQQVRRTELDLGGMRKLLSIPRSIGMLKGLVKLNVSYCSKLERLPDEIGDLENLEELHARQTLISRPPSSIIRLNKLKYLSFKKHKSEHGVCFVFPQVNEGLYLTRNNSEHLPRRIAQLGALRSLDLSHCNRLRELPGFTGMPNLDTLNLSYCNLIYGGLPEDIGYLSSLKRLYLGGNNFEHLSIGQLGALRSLDLRYCKRLTHLPEFPQQLDTMHADWSNDLICNSLFQNISSLQHDISTSDSVSLRVFTTWHLMKNIPSWFHHRGAGTSVSINLPENWYVCDNFLGFAVCYSGRLIDARVYQAHLISYDGMSRITKTLALSNHSEYSPESAVHFLLVPFAGLWDTSKANGKTPNDYGNIRLFSSREMKEFGLRLLYKDEVV
ncbi:hypothetical protein R3W88_029095 [Solanum pinnatisectum]|uniref:ADP-ribosyl cyclase/cyclic ADP-ribose hydrolase n=1 Tax=Solanum pinnatisectum TaxID=50273 RepID=A0AAV9K6H5_9SOLN|nr:hypothetical protein R3W88_029095 [Solanum pinnatisectum]